MKFHEQRLMYDMARQSQTYRTTQNRADWYKTRLDTMEAKRRDKDPEAPTIDFHLQLVLEEEWLRGGRPYYSVYPFIAESLTKVKLDLDSSLAVLPQAALLVRFAAGHEPMINGGPLRSILAANVHFLENDSLYFAADYHEDPGKDAIREGRWPHPLHFLVPQIEGYTVEEYLASLLDEKVDWKDKDREDCITCMRILMSLCLLANDHSIIKPDVLNDDVLKYEKTLDPKYVEKAHRRGKVGWLVGADIQVDPHFRRAHFALRWTGEGGKIPKIVPVKSAIVHRAKVTEVPTGYMDEVTADA